MVEKLKQLDKKLDELTALIQEQNLLQKDVLNFHETCQYLKLSEASLHRLKANSELPFYRPSKRGVYFKRKELDQWLLQNKSNDKTSIEDKAFAYIEAHKTNDIINKH